MRRLLQCSFLALLVASPALGQEGGVANILEGEEVRDLDSQDIDPNEELVRLLETLAIKPAKFAVSPGEVTLRAEVGEVAKTTVRLRNSGGKPGAVYGVNTVGSFEGLSIDSACGAELENGKFCDVTITFESDRPRTLSTALSFAIDGDQRTEISVPVTIDIVAPPEPEPEPEPVVIVRPEPVKPTGPSSADVARRYFGAMGGMRAGMGSPSKGIEIISAKPTPPAPRFAGVGYDDMRVETRLTQDRYDEDIPSTQASLPVDRDKILTSDRVIKAVLETPVSNVMCGKVVALVESDVYSATSSKPLIQAGSRVVGECGSFVGNRTGIAWNRIITTDGRSISFSEEADTRDANGLGGAVGHRYSPAFDKYVLPIFSTMIDTAAGVIMATFGEDEKVVIDENGNTTKETSAQNEGIRIVTTEARGTAQQIISDIRDVREIAVIPAGSRIDVEISEDIYFKDSREVVRLADMTFDLEDISLGEAERDLPEQLSLVPAGADYDGPSVMIGGRAYKVEERRSPEDEEEEILPRPRTLDEITGSEEQ